MTYKLTWLASILRDVGLKVIEYPGWQTRGHGDMGNVRGVLCHHTAGPRAGNAPSLGVVVDGRPDLAGPLAQLVLGRDGTYYVVAAGRCYHAGAGQWQGIVNGNSEMIGIEAENTGNADDNPWPVIQFDAYVHGVAALLKYIGAKPIMCAGHLEYALPVGRKPDPSFSVGDRADRIRAMNEFRSAIAQKMGVTVTNQEKEDQMTPASIRTKNPGAMWGKGNAVAKKWGSTQTLMLNDGLNQGNNIAVFPDYVSGICAQMDLWRTSKNYKDKRLDEAIATWSGHNEVESYITFVLKRVPSLTRSTVMNDAFWRGPMAIPFLKAQAWHEAGVQYPAPDADWIEAQRRVLAGVGNSVGGTTAKAGTAVGPPVIATVAIDKMARKPVEQGGGIDWMLAIPIIVVALSVSAVIWFIWPKRKP